jgi:putative hydrolase of the HAD superfamily
MPKIDVIAWDFDGVLNRNVVNDRFLWVWEMEKQFGYCPKEFVKQVIHDFDPVMAGKECILDRLNPWVEYVGYDGTAEDFLQYWFQMDRYPDPVMDEMMKIASEAGITNVMATNNEARRGRFIWYEMGFEHQMDKLFTAGEMGKIKPHAEFFQHICDDLNVEPGRVLFVDDMAANIKNARAIGMHGHHFIRDQYDDLKEVLADLVESSFQVRN